MTSSPRHHITAELSAQRLTNSLVATWLRGTCRSTVAMRRYLFMLTIDRDQQLDQLLGTSIAEFDIPDDVYELAVARYKHLGNWFSGYWAKSHSDGEVYPQGSFRLGTVVRPINPRDHYDI